MSEQTRPLGGVAVLVSGQGTILEAIVAAHVPVDVVISDRPCRGLSLASDAGIETLLVDRADFGGFTTDFDREAYTVALTEVLAARAPALIAMAGFGTVLTAPIHDEFGGRILNTHPALLPLFPGWHGVRDALAAGVTETGCTVHLATVEMDVGPILAQGVVPVARGESEAEVHEKIKTVERTLYPATIAAALDAVRRGVPVVTIATERNPR